MKPIKRRSDCPISFALEIFGDKWSLLIVRDLMLRGKVYFGEMLGSEEAIATNILANRLQRLVNEGVITKKIDPNKKTKFIYSLTQKGIDLVPAMLELILWSAKYDPDTAAPMEFISQAQADKSSLIKGIEEGLRHSNPLFS